MVVLAKDVLLIKDKATYLLEGGVTLVDSHDLSGGLNQMKSLVMVYEFLLHASVVLDIWWLIHSLWDLMRVRKVTGLSVG